MTSWSIFNHGQNSMIHIHRYIWEKHIRMLSVLCNYLFTVEKNEEGARLKKNKQRRRKVIHVVQRQKI